MNKYMNSSKKVKELNESEFFHKYKDFDPINLCYYIKKPISIANHLKNGRFIFYKWLWNMKTNKVSERELTLLKSLNKYEHELQDKILDIHPCKLTGNTRSIILTLRSTFLKNKDAELICNINPDNFDTEIYYVMIKNNILLNVKGKYKVLVECAKLYKEKMDYFNSLDFKSFKGDKNYIREILKILDQEYALVLQYLFPNNIERTYVHEFIEKFYPDGYVIDIFDDVNKNKKIKVDSIDTFLDALIKENYI